MNNILSIKKNNKGNTLPIVLVGIFVLAILGTLILSMTATNYNIKVTEKKSESTFYYAEKAIDEVYAGIGKEVMDCAKASFEEVMTNYVYDVLSPSGSTVTTTLNETDANSKFIDLYLHGNGTTVKGVETLYQKGDTAIIQSVLDRLEASFVENVPNITTKLVALDGTAGTDKSEIEYIKDAVSGETKEILIKNVCVKTIVASSGYYSSLLVDFNVKVPNVDFSITDETVNIDNNVDDLSQYSLIAQGSSVGDVNKANEYYPTVLVENNVTSKIKGNVYAGTGANGISNWIYAGNPGDSDDVKRNNVDSWYERSAVAVGVNSLLNIEAKNVVCDGPVTVAGGSIDFRGIGKFGASFADTNYTDNADVLNLYATDLITTKENANINIIGNCMISDDLEINGNQSSVAIKGNYYGYGFQAVNDEEIVGKSNGDIREANSGITDTGFVPPDIAVKKEHEKRSAIIVNGKRADVDLTGLNTLILAGRAYIDLDSGTQFGNASYMTGESISFKGNQQMYLADSATGLEGANDNVVNPMGYDELKQAAGLGDNMEFTAPSYSSLGLDSDKVVAKKIGSKVYFYNKEIRSVKQSQYFVSTYYMNDTKREEADKLVKDTLEVNNLKFRSNLSYYTVGVFMSVEDGELKVPNNYNEYAKSADFSRDKFYNLVKEMRIRKDHMTPTLEALDYKIENSSIYNATPLYNKTETVYDYHVADLSGVNIEEQDLIGNHGTKTVTYNGTTKTIAEFIEDITGKTAADVAAGYKIGFCINGVNTSSTTLNINEGIYICKAPVNINRDFKGLLITDASVQITNNANIESNEELIKFMCTCDDPSDVFLELRKALKLETSSASIPALAIASDGISSADLVEKSNWRKNTN